MARYRMDDGAVVDTKKATHRWLEDEHFDGHNYISAATDDQWRHETLYRSRRGRYYLVSWSDWQGGMASAEWVTRDAAAAWLLAQSHKLPKDLADLAEVLE